MPRWDDSHMAPEVDPAQASVVVLARFEDRRAAEHMLASLGRGFRKKARHGDGVVALFLVLTGGVAHHVEDAFRRRRVSAGDRVGARHTPSRRFLEHALHTPPLRAAQKRHIVNGEVKGVDIGDNQVQGVDVKDKSLSGADLGVRVRSAKQVDDGSGPPPAAKGPSSTST
jgi:hypothetical protein